MLAELERLFERRRQTGYGPLYDLLADYPVPRGQGPASGDLLRRVPRGGRPHRAGARSPPPRSSSSTTRSSCTTTSRTARSSAAARSRCFEAHGAPVAINVGDATNVLAMELLLANTETHRRAQGAARLPRGRADGARVGRGPGDRARLDRRGSASTSSDRDYVRMAYKKTCWYTVIAPLRIGVICGSPPGPLAPLEEELHAADRARLPRRHRLPDPRRPAQPRGRRGRSTARRSAATSGRASARSCSSTSCAPPQPRQRARALRLLARRASRKDRDDVAWLLEAMVDAGSLEHGRALALEYSRARARARRPTRPVFTANDDRRFLREMLRYVIDRVK